MTCQWYKDFMMAYLDDELDDQQRKAFEEHIKLCRDCATELEQFTKLKQLTDSVELAEPEDETWQRYWSGVYNRLERGIGWCLMSIAGICLAIYGGFKIVEQMIEDPTVSVILKVAILAFIAGVAVLFVSILRERLYFWKTDRYRDVRR